MKTNNKVLYEAIEQALDPFKKAILDQFDDIYKVTEEDKLADKYYEYKLSDFLTFASDIAYEVEHES